MPRWRRRLAQSGRHIHIIHRRGESNLKSIRKLRRGVANLRREFREFRDATESRVQSNSEGIKSALELLGTICAEGKKLMHDVKEMKKQKKQRRYRRKGRPVRKWRKWGKIEDRRETKSKCN